MPVSSGSYPTKIFNYTHVLYCAHVRACAQYIALFPSYAVGWPPEATLAAQGPPDLCTTAVPWLAPPWAASWARSACVSCSATLSVSTATPIDATCARCVHGAGVGGAGPRLLYIRPSNYGRRGGGAPPAARPYPAAACGGQPAASARRTRGAVGPEPTNRPLRARAREHARGYRTYVCRGHRTRWNALHAWHTPLLSLGGSRWPPELGPAGRSRA
jgi:hypothetical protein